MMNEEERNKVRHIMRSGNTARGEKIYTEKTRITARYGEKIAEHVYAELKEAFPERKITKKSAKTTDRFHIKRIYRVTIYI